MGLLPSHPGLLPYWFLLTSSLSLFNTLGCYTTRTIALKTYQSPLASTEVTDFASRMFGTWTALACIIRIFAAYKIDNPDVYKLTLCTYAIALGHFLSEWLVFGTMVPGRGLVPVLGFAGVSVVWMTVMRGFYLKGKKV